MKRDLSDFTATPITVVANGDDPTFHADRNYRRTEDGPEVELIRFFTRFPNGATCNCDAPFNMWKEVASKVRPNA